MGGRYIYCYRIAIMLSYCLPFALLYYAKFLVLKLYPLSVCIYILCPILSLLVQAIENVRQYGQTISRYGVH